MVKKICGFLSAILIIVLAGIAALLIVPKILGMQGMAVLTGSMEPNIHVGAIVYVKEVSWDDLEVGDVVTYALTGDTYVTHRIAEINDADQTVTTKGDANDSPDGTPVAYSNILGKMQFEVPYLGYVSIYAKTPIGIAAICGVLVVVILLVFLPDILTEDDKSVKKTEEEAPESEEIPTKKH